jgi:large repetitive protein
MGPNGDTAFSAANPAVAHNPTSNGYLVAWEGDDDRGPLVDNEREIYVQRLSAKGVQRGVNDRRISDMGPVGQADFEAGVPSLAYNPATGEYLVAWDASDDTGALVDEEDEIFTQRLSASGAQVGTDDRRISQMGPDGETKFDATNPSVAVGTRTNEYLVAWPARTTPARWSPTRTRSTPSGSAPMGPRSAATTCASRRWARTATIAATASPPRSPTARRPTST